jgi:8-oxo-dGTP diphosphatase
MIPVACALIEDELGRLLIAKRPEGKCLGGLWEFPGGKLENGESPEMALRRELREELRIETEILEVLEPVEHHYDKFSICLIPCRTKILAGIPYPTEHSEIAWLHPGQIDLENLAPADIPILAKISSS